MEGGRRKKNIREGGEGRKKWRWKKRQDESGICGRMDGVKDRIREKRGREK